MSESSAVQSAETGNAPSDSGTGASVEAGEKGAPGAAANDNAPQASNDNMAGNTRSGGGGVRKGQLEAGEGSPAKPANDNALGADASQVTTADNSVTGSRISEMKNGELPEKFGKSVGDDKVADKKGGGGKGGGGDGEDGDGEDSGGDKNKGTEKPGLANAASETDVLVGTDAAPNSTQATETGAGGDDKDQSDKEEPSDKKPTDAKTGGVNAEVEEDSLEEGDQEAVSTETDGNGGTKPATDGTDSSSDDTKMPLEMQKALDQFKQSKADPTAATSRASFSPGQESSADRTKAQSKPNGPRGPHL